MASSREAFQVDNKLLKVQEVDYEDLEQKPHRKPTAAADGAGAPAVFSCSAAKRFCQIASRSPVQAKHPIEPMVNLERRAPQGGGHTAKSHEYNVLDCGTTITPQAPHPTCAAWQPGRACMAPVHTARKVGSAASRLARLKSISTNCCTVSERTRKLPLTHAGHSRRFFSTSAIAIPDERHAEHF